MINFFKLENLEIQIIGSKSIRYEVSENCRLSTRNSSDKAIRKFEARYDAQWNHQCLENPIIVPDENHSAVTGPIDRCQRLDGMLSQYCRTVEL